MHLSESITNQVEAHVRDYFNAHIDGKYVFHNIQHTENVVAAVKEIGEGYSLHPKETEILEIAAWFHDIGYDEGSQDHEERSCRNAQDFLSKLGYADDHLERILGCIRATKLPHQPKNLLEQIICDADMSHLGKKIYWSRCGKLRQELILTKNDFLSDNDWVDFELDFMLKHSFHTTIAQELYGKLKAKHIRQLYKQKRRLNPEFSTDEANVPDDAQNSSLTTAFEVKQLNLGRGVETMYRTTYRTHVNLSSIADNKANIMLSINAIIVSIIVSTLVPSLSDHPYLVIPAIILLIVCLLSIVYATLSTRPKITEGKVTREMIQQKKSNLLFFGNFYNMSLDDFHWGMMQMIKDQDFLYSSMTRDLYYLGIVLSKKYRYLSICYAIFMYGLILAVVAFAISFVINSLGV